MSRRGSQTPARPRSSSHPDEAVRLAVAVGRSDAIRHAADSVVEACVLVAVVSLPLYFTTLTSTGYDADKALLLRVLASVAGSAWLIGVIAGPRGRWQLRSLNPIVLVSVVLFIVYGVATLTSIDPRLSLWGSATRQQGLWTQASYLIFFVVAATRLRRAVQWDRVVTCLVVGSAPVVLYGILQQFGFNLGPSYGDPSVLAFPVRSTFGEHVFLGSYLVLVIPFTAARVLQNRDWRSAPLKTGAGVENLLWTYVPAFIVLTFFGVVALAYRQTALFAALPLLLAGYALLSLVLVSMRDSAPVRLARFSGYAALLGLQLLALAISGARGAWLGFAAGATVSAFLLSRRAGQRRLSGAILAFVAIGAIFIALLNVSGGPLRPLRSVHAFDRVANITDSGGTEGSGLGRLLIWRGIKDLMIHHPAIGNTWSGWGRDLIGYGPESLSLAFQPVIPLKLRQLAVENWTWDRAHNAYLNDLVDAGLLGLLALLGVIVLVIRALNRLVQGADDATAWLALAAATALSAHLVDAFLGIETPVTLFLLWMIAGLAAATPFEENQSAQTESRNLPQVLRYSGWVWLGLLAFLGLLALVPAAGDHPALLGGIWIAGIIAGVAAVAVALLPRTVLAPAPTRQRQRKAVAAPQRPVMRRRLWVPVLVAVLTAGMIWSQTELQVAAVAERSGLAALRTGQVAGGLGSLQEAARANPYEPGYDLDLVAVYSALAARGRQPDDATVHLSSSSFASIDPESVLTLGRNQLYQLALDSATRARSLAPLNPDIYTDLGNVDLQWHRPAEALQEFQYAERLSPGNPRYVADDALAQVQIRHLQTARVRAEVAARLDDRFWYGHFALARVDHALGKRADAQAQAKKAYKDLRYIYPPPPPDQVAQLQKLEQAG